MAPPCSHHVQVKVFACSEPGLDQFCPKSVLIFPGLGDLVTCVFFQCLAQRCSFGEVS